MHISSFVGKLSIIVHYLLLYFRSNLSVKSIPMLFDNFDVSNLESALFI